jgi:hypothetical protein
MAWMSPTVLDAGLVHSLFGDFAYAGDTADGEGKEEGLDFVGLDDEEAVGLFPVGGDFGEEFVGCDAG